MPRRNPPPASTPFTFGTIPVSVPSVVRDLPVIFAAFALFYALLSLASYWATPISVETQIDLSPAALPKYAMYRRVLSNVLADEFVRPGVLSETDAVALGTRLLRDNVKDMFKV